MCKHLNLAGVIIFWVLVQKKKKEKNKKRIGGSQGSYTAKQTNKKVFNMLLDAFSAEKLLIFYILNGRE